jgi:predicted Zn-dependent peptidase
LLYQEIVKKQGLTGSISGGINAALGDMFNYSGPMLWTASLIYDPGIQPEQILSAADSVIEDVRAKPVDRALLNRSVTKLRSSLYDSITRFGGFGRADLLASFALFDDNPARINSLETEFRKVTPELIQKTAREYLRKTNRTVLEIEPGAKPAGAAGKGQP